MKRDQKISVVLEKLSNVYPVDGVSLSRLYLHTFLRPQANGCLVVVNDLHVFYGLYVVDAGPRAGTICPIIQQSTATKIQSGRSPDSLVLSVSAEHRPRFTVLDLEASNPKRLTVIDALCQLFTVRDRILDRLHQA